MTEDRTKQAWATASTKYEREYDEHLEQARDYRLLPIEEDLLSQDVGAPSSSIR